MAATDPARGRSSEARRQRGVLAVAALWALLMVGFQNCAVDLSSTTPGASTLGSLSDCTLSTSQSDSFEIVMNSIFQGTGPTPVDTDRRCAKCHASGVGGFTIYTGNTTTNPQLIKKNACNVIATGRKVATEPQQPIGHGGGQYSATEIQLLINWVNQYVP